MRIFISVELPDSVKEKTAELIKELKGIETDIKWVDPKNLHITLKFLGWIEEKQFDNLTALATSAVSGSGSFKAIFRDLGTFPEGKSPRVVWVGAVEGGDKLCILAKVLEEKLSKAGFKAEEKTFKPHITIGRIKDKKGVDNIKEKIIQFKNTAFGEMTVDRVFIMKSTLTPGGPIYEKIKEIKL